MLVGIEDNLGPVVNPETCGLVGKECRECISGSASVLAMLCPSLDAAGAQQMFFKMYRHHGCGGMARAFVREYLDQVEPEFIDMAPTMPLYQIAACA
ncbi:MAG: hypothetical protein FJW36_13265 [Acidobacteria bacterium]|nr:hypothetical protein [Acidobacteriota bacterium]